MFAVQLFCGVRVILTCIADVIVLTAMGEESAIDAKEAPKG